MQTGCAMLRALIVDISRCDAPVLAAGIPGIGHIAILDGYATSLPAASRLTSNFLRFDLVTSFSRQNQLIPEQRLQGIERDPLLLQEIHLRIVCLDILLVITVQNQHIIRSKLRRPNSLPRKGMKIWIRPAGPCACSTWQERSLPCLPSGW